MIKIEDLNKAKELLNSDKVAEAIELLGRLIKDEDTNLKDESPIIVLRQKRFPMQYKKSINSTSRERTKNKTCNYSSDFIANLYI